MDTPPPLPDLYKVTAHDQRWRRLRLLYYGLQILLFAAIAFRAGPNLILFRSIFSPAPADYVRFTPPYATTIAAIKAYNRDKGELPSDNYDLPPMYKPANAAVDRGEIAGTTSITFAIPGSSVLEYEFSPAKEGWYVHSPRYDGPLPTPIVTAAIIPLVPPLPTTTATAASATAPTIK